MIVQLTVIISLPVLLLLAETADASNE
jgi:hypothetical protein